MKRRNIILILLATLIAAISIYLIMFKKTSITVEEIEPEEVRITKKITANGIVEAEDIANVGFSNSGKIIKINFTERSYVTKGDVIAVLDRNKFYNDAKAAKDARDIILREKDLFIEQFKKDDVYQQTDEYRLKIRQFDERVSQAQASYNSILSGSNNYELVAPINGVLNKITKVENEFVSPGEIIAEIIDTNSIYFKASLNQEDLGEVTSYQPATITLDAYKNELFNALVSELPLTATVTNTDSVFDIKLDFVLPEKNIIVGMIGDANFITLDTESPVQALYFDQVQTDTNGYYVWIDNNGKADKFYVELGVEGDLYTEILTSLQDKTIISPKDTSIEIKVGDEIKIENES